MRDETEKNQIILSLSSEDIRKCVFILQGKPVMLDCDLAVFYGYEVKALNQQVK